jgi:malonyl CoA-acyl carrier protein transacylase
MGEDLIETSSAFRATMERLQANTSLPLVDLYKDGSKWFSKEYSTLGIVSFQSGLLAILRDHGVRSPDYFLGHSTGELVCAFLAGLASEEEVLQYAVVWTRLAGSIDPAMRLDVFENEPVDGFDNNIVKLVLFSLVGSKEPTKHVIE